LVNKPIIQFKEKPDRSSLGGDYIYNNYTLALAIANYIGKGTQIKMFDYDFLKAGRVGDSDKDFNLDRLMCFMIDNGMNTLQYYTRKAQLGLFEGVKAETKKKHRVITIVLIVDQVVIVMLLILFVPFILKVQSSLLKIYLHLCQFKSKDIVAWVEDCNESGEFIKASVSQMYKIYGKTSFELKSVNDKEETDKGHISSQKNKIKAASAKAKCINKGIFGDCLLDTDEEGVEKNEKQDEEGDQLLISKEKVITEQKQNMFSRMTRNKTAVYLIYLGIFIAYIAIFRITDALIFSSIYTKTDSIVYLYETFSIRSYYGLLSLFFLREKVVRNETLTDFECIFFTQS